MTDPALDNIYERAKQVEIETFSGRMFNILEPKFDYDDISHALALLCRYNGHCRAFYSVAEHSCLVATIMSFLHSGDPREGLLHDAAEAYLSDVAAPLKQLFPEWRALERELENKLRDYYELPNPRTTECKEADLIALFIEAYFLMPDKGERYIDPGNYRDQAMWLIDEGFTVDCWSPDEAERIFRATWKTVEGTRQMEAHYHER